MADFCIDRPMLRRVFRQTALMDRKLGEAASIVASLPEVRKALLAYQRNFATRKPGVVIDGRDIGTVIFPDAAVKLFVTASADVRARRRWLERRAASPDADLGAGLAQVAAEMQARDNRDAGREAAPLRPAADAAVLDTTALDADAAFARALAIVRERLGSA